MLLSVILSILVLWWLLSYLVDYECEAIDRLYYRICADNPEILNPRELALFIVGGPIRLTGEALKENSRNKPKR
jgi:hypothetical protein